MSKLIFPKHGGMHIDDDDRIVKTVKHKDRDGTYTIKIISHPSVFPREKQYQWHYLSPWGGTGHTSGYRDSIKGIHRGRHRVHQEQHQPRTETEGRSPQVSRAESPGPAPGKHPLLQGAGGRKEQRGAGPSRTGGRGAGMESRVEPR